jgi:glycosyltransferase involved in cell wall biosynthesis
VKVAFDARGASDPRGIGRYVSCIQAALGTTAPDGASLVSSHRPRRVDVFHAPWIEGALLRSPVPMVVTLHDLVPLKRKSEYLRTGMRFNLRYLAVRRSARVIVPTEVVARDAVELLGFPRERIDVIPEAAALSLRPADAAAVAAVRERYSLPDRYLLWVGGLEHPDPRKRVAALAEAPRTMPLVLVGKHRRWASEISDVTLTGHVSDEDLAAIYTAAHALVFPSDDEGFGLPPVEALACGTPVVACDVPAVREVLGDRATFVPQGDLGALVLAAEAAERPAPAPLRWSWDDAADATWTSYRKAVGFQGPAAPIPPALTAL